MTIEQASKKPRPAWWPKRVTEADYRELIESFGGLCLSCGTLQWSDLEPDARGRECDDCGARKATGAEWALTIGALEIGS